MRFTLRDILNYQLHAEDGDFGEIRTILFDDFEWTARYLVVRVGSRNVLLSVGSLGAPDAQNHLLPVNITKAKIMNSPTFDPDRPVSRETERRFSDYFGWSLYWEPEDVPNTLPGDLTSVPLIDMEIDREEKEEDEEDELIAETGGNPTESREINEHLHSLKQVLGFSILAANDDRTAGKLVDMVSQDEDWNILYLVVDTGGVLPGKKVLLAPSWVKQIDLDNLRIEVNLTRQTVQNSQQYTSIVDLNSNIKS